MTRKDFIVIANMLAVLLKDDMVLDTKLDIACEHLAKTNPNFNSARFQKAVKDSMARIDEVLNQ